MPGAARPNRPLSFRCSWATVEQGRERSHQNLAPAAFFLTEERKEKHTAARGVPPAYYYVPLSAVSWTPSWPARGAAAAAAERGQVQPWPASTTYLFPTRAPGPRTFYGEKIMVKGGPWLPHGTGEPYQNIQGRPRIPGLWPTLAAFVSWQTTWGGREGLVSLRGLASVLLYRK